MDIQLEFIIAAKLLLAMLFGGFIGYERERNQKSAGVRTFGSICMAACLFVTIAAHLTDDKSAIARMLAAIATGLGFIGAGIIFRDSGSNTKGLTTTTGLWTTAAIGAAVALNMYVLASLATVLLFLLLRLSSLNWYRNLVQGDKEKGI